MGSGFPVATAAARLLLVVIAGTLLLAPPTTAVSPTGTCDGKSNGCHDPDAALRLKVIAIFAILVASMIGVCLPLITRSLKALHPDGKIFTILKAFSSGVILATGYMHVLPDSFDDLTSPCLPQTPWRNFPFTTFVAMISAIFTLMVDSFATSLHGKVTPADLTTDDAESSAVVTSGTTKDEMDHKLSRHRIIAQVRQESVASSGFPFHSLHGYACLVLSDKVRLCALKYI